MIQRALRIRRHLTTAAAFLTVSMMMAPAAYASGSSMPWEQPLEKILQSIEGPVAKIVAVIIIIVTGLTLAFGDTSGGFRRLIQIVFGLSIAFAASSFFASRAQWRKRSVTTTTSGISAPNVIEYAIQTNGQPPSIMPRLRATALLPRAGDKSRRACSSSAA